MPEQSPPNGTPSPIYGFVAGTPILTADGSKPIEQLRPGDVIQARPAGEVCAVFVTRKPIFLLHLNGQVIRTTADHPFYVAGQGWTEASDLQVGDRLHTHDGQAVAIEAISESQEENGDVVDNFFVDHPLRRKATIYPSRPRLAQPHPPEPANPGCGPRRWPSRPWARRLRCSRCPTA
jgi:hypothetical protein